MEEKVEMSLESFKMFIDTEVAYEKILDELEDLMNLIKEVKE